MPLRDPIAACRPLVPEGDNSQHSWLASRVWTGALTMVFWIVLAGMPIAPEPTLADQPGGVDTALVISIDVSSSVNERRYRLQLEGIAAAIEDNAVVNSVLSGPNAAIAVTVVAWADEARKVVPWTIVTNAQDASALAARIRGLDQQDGEFTCIAKMLHYVGSNVVVGLPVAATKTIVDVSGDGPDNCNSGGLLKFARSQLLAGGSTINGLPIIEGEHADMLQGWYLQNVVAGDAAFNMPAMGYEDFARAFRQKFIMEMSEHLDGASRRSHAPAVPTLVVR